jgi:bifunctional DNA-binding transcriptional regulator/antitoxin component of YhaV-PrlF toxin-antitoxin module
MVYKTILTSKGTTTIPVEIRKQLGIEPGMQITFMKNKSGEYVIKCPRTIEEIRVMNTQALKQAATADKEYTSGSGFILVTLDTFGK